MGTNAEISLLLKNGKEYTIYTQYDGGLHNCGKHLWEWLRSLTLGQWDKLNERLEKATWLEGHEKASTYGLMVNHTECNFDCPRKPTEHTVFDVLRQESYVPFQVLRSVMNGERQHMIHVESGYTCYDYQIDFNLKTFSVWDGEYLEMPFTCKRARFVFGSTVNLDESMSSREDADQEPAIGPGDAMSRSHDGYLTKKRPNTTESSNIQKKPKTAPSTAPNHEFGSDDSAVDTVPSFETHIQSGQTVQLSEDRARSEATEATEATEVATPRNQELGSPTNPILLLDDTCIL